MTALGASLKCRRRPSGGASRLLLPFIFFEKPGVGAAPALQEKQKRNSERKTKGERQYRSLSFVESQARLSRCKQSRIFSETPKSLRRVVVGRSLRANKKAPRTGPYAPRALLTLASPEGEHVFCYPRRQRESASRAENVPRVLHAPTNEPRRLCRVPTRIFAWKLEGALQLGCVSFSPTAAPSGGPLLAVCGGESLQSGTALEDASPLRLSST